MISRTHGRRAAGGVAVVALLLLVACGGNNGPSGTKTTQLGGSVSVWAVWSGAEQQSFTRVLDAFRAKTGVTANFQSKGDQLPTVLGTAIAGGSPPDVAVLPQPGLLHDLVGKGVLKPIDNLVGDTVKSDFASTWSK